MPRKLGSEDKNVKTCLTCKGEKEVWVYQNRKRKGRKICPACNGKGGTNLGVL